MADVPRLIEIACCAASAPERLASVQAIRDIARGSALPHEKRATATHASPELRRLSREDPDDGVRAAALEAVTALETSLHHVCMFQSPCSSGDGASPSEAQTFEGSKRLPPGRVAIQTPFASSSSSPPAAPVDSPPCAADDKEAHAAAERQQHIADKLAAQQRIRAREDDAAAKPVPAGKKSSLKAALTRLRQQLCGDKPAYCVYSNATMDELIARQPVNDKALLQVKGVGPATVKSYGKQIIACIKEHATGGAQSTGLEPAPPPKPPVQLNREQLAAMKAVVTDSNLFLTGGAGTGKSFTLHQIIETLSATKGAGSVFITGSTGIAACHLGGCTLHSFAGVGLGKESVPALLDRIQQKPHALKQWRACEALVIDEVSMIDGNFFDKLEELARCVKENEQPFGGIQLVLSGDFFQLPPVGLEKGGLRFLFEASCWRRVVGKTVVLREVHRQKEPHFVKMLEELRRAALSPFSLSLLQQAVQNGRRQQPSPLQPSPLPPPVSGSTPPAAADGSNPSAAATPPPAAGSTPPPLAAPDAQPTTRLFAHNADADDTNEMQLAALPHRPMCYVAANVDPTGRMLEGCSAPPKLTLKEGAQVVLLKNLDQAKKLVNGSRGVVVGFSASDAPRRRGVDVVQAPSEVRPRAAEEANLPQPQPLNLYPRVRFFNGGEERVLVPEQWSIESGGREVASRVQVPCKLAWAISIHKSQGMTLEHLEVDLASCFDHGQCYVALSRATSMKSTKVLSFDPNRVRAHPKVARFYSALDAESQLERQHEQQAAAAAAAAPAAAGASASVPSQQASSGGGMSAEQLARMAANREAALAKRRAAQS